MCVALVALLVALAGTGYAALKLPKNSVGTKQLKKASVTAAKIKKGAVGAAQVQPGSLPASVFQAGVLPQPSTAYLGQSIGPFSTSGNGQQAIIATVSLPSPGAYTLTADGFAFPTEKKGNLDQVICTLFGPGDQGLAGMPSQLTLTDRGEQLVIIGAAEVAQAGTVRMICSQFAIEEPDKISFIGGRIVATKVGSLVKG
jgi:hypothetical protein